METETGLRRHADLVHGHDAEHQRAGRIADAVDDDALAMVADALVPGLVFFDIAAVIARDVQIGARRRRGEKAKAQQSERRDAHEVMKIRQLFRTGSQVHGPDQMPKSDLKTLAGLCWEFVKHPLKTKNWR